MRPSFIAQTLLVLMSCVELSLAQAPSLPIASQSELAWVTAEVKAPLVSFQTFDSDSVKTQGNRTSRASWHNDCVRI